VVVVVVVFFGHKMHPLVVDFDSLLLLALSVLLHLPPYFSVSLQMVMEGGEIYRMLMQK
jgi:hypothetical protein